MGSLLSGNYSARFDRRQTVDEVPSLDVATLAHGGLITPGMSEYCGQPLTWTACNYGGMRPWWICQQCDRKVRKLYRVGGVIECRKCADLGYHSEQVSGQLRKYFFEVTLPNFYRTMRSPIRVNPPGTVPWFAMPPRPKGMRKATYARHIKELDEAHQAVLRQLFAHAAAALPGLQRVLQKSMEDSKSD
ncbi:hypothetical protein [Leptolyngbya sp. FACHB-8]|uniref:hypothetical protein n=1 Tax=unclassified Leptolyngbya TaxID=2650499 RepID=UPI001689F554|nr:hypothetical protein [Leptolyngbya sp. FACHB-8]MBD1910269.1 hypothetical protein [Leptolyngbya sp. FACHB-8]